MDSTQALLLSLAGGADVPKLLGGGGDHIVAALVVGWVVYSLVGRRLSDSGLRFFAVSTAAAAALAADAPILVICFAVSALGATVVLHGLTGRRLALNGARRRSNLAAA